jgi:hypothetical protein
MKRKYERDLEAKGTRRWSKMYVLKKYYYLRDRKGFNVPL